MVLSVQDVVRGMSLPPGYNHEALEQLANMADAYEREIERLKAVNERDRSQVAEVYSAIIEAIRRREWLRLGRGSYEYDDDRWRGEFSEAIDEVIAAAKPLQRIAADWSDCPTDPKVIAAARANASVSEPPKSSES